MTDNERDISLMYRSLKTLNGYLEMSKAGRLEFAMDIPTQIHKIFFDRSSRNHDTTLFERVCGEKVITFHLICYTLLITKTKTSMSMSYHEYLDYLDINNQNEISSDESEIQFDLFALNATPIPFEAWKKQIIQITNLILEPKELLVSDVRIRETAISSEESQEMLNKSFPDIILFFEKIQKVHNLWYSHLISLSDNPLEVPQISQNLPPNSNIIFLPIEEFFRIIRHKDSAHADPMDNTKLQKEYDLLNAANAFSDRIGGTRTTYERLVIIIADYLVNRVKEQLFSEKN
jgi:hypothetical protein